MTLRLKPLNYGGLLIRQYFSLDIIQSQFARDRLCCRSVVACQHDQANALRAEKLNCLGR